jgi:hypothetical protein
MAQERFSSPSACDLLICDEAHRLKNDETLTNKVRPPAGGVVSSCAVPDADSVYAQALDSLTCRRRVLLSGTPIQARLSRCCPLELEAHFPCARRITWMSSTPWSTSPTRCVLH